MASAVLFRMPKIRIGFSTLAFTLMRAPSEAIAVLMPPENDLLVFELSPQAAHSNFLPNVSHHSLQAC